MENPAIDYELAAKLHNAKHKNKLPFSAATIRTQVHAQGDVEIDLGNEFDEAKELKIWLENFGILNEYQEGLALKFNSKSVKNNIPTEKPKSKTKGEAVKSEESKNEKGPATFDELLRELNQKVSTLIAGRKVMKFEDIKDLRLHIGAFELVDFFNEKKGKQSQYLNFTLKDDWENYIQIGSSIVFERFKAFEKGLENLEFRKEFDEKGVIAVFSERESEKSGNTYQTVLFMPVSSNGSNIPPNPFLKVEPAGQG